MEQFEQRLAYLWKEGSRDIAVSFLRRAVSIDINLAELLVALQFPDVQQYLGSIRLKDVLRLSSAAPSPAKPMTVPPRAKRKRRSGEEMQQIKNHILRLLVAEPGTLNTSQICSALQEAGHEVDTIRANVLLKALEKDGLVADLGGKPKSWRAQHPGKRTAEPVLIKKKQAS